MSRSKGALLADGEASCAEQLARFFPQVAPVRIAVQLVAPRVGGRDLQEAVILQFGGTEHAIFLSTLPIEFNDPVRLVKAESGETAEGSVVAVQYDEGRKAVAVRFTSGPCSWVKQR